MPPTLLRLFSLAAVLAVLPVAQAQTNCVDGFAGPYACDSVNLMARIPVGVDGPFRTNNLNDIWGWTDPQTDREYALVGTRSGTVFVDVTMPDSPLVLGKLLTATDNSTWRDIKVYQNYAFVVSEASGHGMQVFDLTQLRGLSEDSNRDFTEDVLYTGTGSNTVGSAHNIAINEDTGFAYIVGANDCAGGLHMVDIQSPTSPIFAGCFSADGYTHDVQCVTYTGPDTDYTGNEICAASNEDTVTLVDVTDKANPSLISKAFYTNPGYTHQGWFMDGQRYFIADDELDDNASATTRTIIFDFEDLDSPEFAFFYFGPVGARDHNLYIRGDYAFLSNYESGLRVLDLSGVGTASISEVALFDTYPDGDANTFEGQWSNYPFFPSGTVIASDQNYGLFVLKTDLPLTTGGEGAVAEIPAGEAFVLEQAQPNPFRTRTTLSLAVARAQTIRVEVVDLNGRRVAVLREGPVAAETPTTLAFDGADLPSGLYLVRVIGEDFQTTQRVSLVR
ncbi:MAG: choice-of-anchor B family protein [Rhodothermaceae bacterium]|nr:choice-of-anchor B family protein [Rhodothermaceae bacterium]